MAQLENIEAIERRLWGSADNLRANSNYKSPREFRSDSLMKRVDDLSEEERRAVKEGLSEESLALFDLLLKPDLSKADINRIKKVAEGLYKTLSAELARIQDFSVKQGTRDDIKVKIKDFLWVEETGLPESFDPGEIDEKTDAVFFHVIMRVRRDTNFGQQMEL